MVALVSRELACDWSLVTGPVLEPLELEDAKLHANILQNDDNALVASSITAARESAQAFLSRALYTQTWQLQLEAFADVIWLPMAAPLQNSAVANPATVPVVQYYDTAGALQTLASTVYTVDTISEPGRLLKAPNQSWPSTQSDRVFPVLITYVCGWTTVDAIPETIKQGMRFAVAAFWADRTGGSADSTAALLAAENLWTRAGPVHWRPPACWP